MPRSSPGAAGAHSWPAGWQKGSGSGGTHSGGWQGAVAAAGVRRRGEGGTVGALARLLDDLALDGPAGSGQRAPCRGKGEESPRLPRGPVVPHRGARRASARGWLQHPGGCKGTGRGWGAPAEHGEPRLGGSGWGHPRSTPHLRIRGGPAPGAPPSPVPGGCGGLTHSSATARDPAGSRAGSRGGGLLAGAPLGCGALRPARLLALGTAGAAAAAARGERPRPRAQRSPRK